MEEGYRYSTQYISSTPEAAYADFFRYRVKSPLIDACIEGGEINGKKISSYTGYDYQYTMYLLTSLVKFSFNIKRRLGYEETYYLPINQESNFKEYKKLDSLLSLNHSISDSMFDEAVTELLATQRHTIYMLEKCNLIRTDGTVKVYRSLNVIELSQIIGDICRNALDNPDYEFTIQTNILMSAERGHSNLNKPYSDRLIKVCFPIPAQHILMHPDFILTSHAEKHRKASTLDYENEVLFFNQHMKGFLKIKSNQVYIEDEMSLSSLVEDMRRNQEDYLVPAGRQSIPYTMHIDDGSYKLMTDTKFLFFHNQLNKILSLLKPRTRNKVIREISK